MENKLKESIKVNILISIALIIAMPLLVIGVFYSKDKTVFDLVLNSTVHNIEIGEDLSQYSGKKVKCSTVNVVSQVTGIYHRNDPQKRPYTISYLITDSNYEHPTLIFFPASKKDQLEDMKDKTYNNMNSEGIELIKPLEVVGHVHLLPNELLDYYIRSMNYFYGEGTADHIKSVYYIDDEDVFTKGDNWVTILAIGITIGIAEVIMLSIMIALIIQSKNLPKVVDNYLLKNGKSMTALDTEFYYAEQIYRNYWVTPDLTVAYDGIHFVVLNNANISSIYIKRIPGKTTSYKLKYYTSELDKCGKIAVNDKTEIVNYYKQNCPHILIE